MLRVRPLVHTNYFHEYVALLTALGMDCVQTQDDGGWQVFDSGNGKVAVRRACADSLPGTSVHLGFELRDAEIFIQRTLADGTTAELAPDAGAARVTAPDGFSFLAHPSNDLSLAHPQARLAVATVWRTLQPEMANTVLANIGAKHVRDSTGGGAVFRMKNGGLVTTAAGDLTGVELGFTYNGGLAELGKKLTGVAVTVGLGGDALCVTMSDGVSLTITS